MIDIAVGAILSIYLFATLLYAAFPKWRGSIFRSEKVVRIIPKWNFFAPIPGTQDFYLLYRESCNGNFSHWREVDFYTYQSDPLTFIWNPNKKGKKILFDIATLLLAQDTTAKEDLMRVKLSIPYLMILNYLSNHCTELAENVQFAIARPTEDQVKSELMYISGIHNV